MTRIANLLLASALAIAPISAFAQTTATPAKPADTAATAPAATSSKTDALPGKTATTTAPAKSHVKTEKHAMAAKTHHKASAPAKTTEPSKL